jgi:hypothetical protein
MSCVDLKYISNEECIGNSLSSINGNFAALSAAVCDLSGSTEFNVVDSPTIDLDWNASTRTLSANANYLLTLINTLSTNMQNIGNYPYLEYAWVTAQNAGGQSLTSGATFTALTLTTKVIDTNNLGSISSNVLTVPAGTYSYEIFAPMYASGGISAILALYNTTTSSYISKACVAINEFPCSKNVLRGVVKLTTQSGLRIDATAANYYGGSVIVYSSYGNLSDSNPTSDQRTTIKLWKMG